MRVITYKVERELDNRCTLVKENSVNYGDVESLKTPKDVLFLMNGVYRINRQIEEYVYVIATNAKGRTLGIFELSHGGMTESLVNPREIFVRLSLIGATGFFLIHNHPTGDTSPSSADRDVTRRVKEASKIMGTEFHDHLIIGEDTYYSFRENGEI